MHGGSPPMHHALAIQDTRENSDITPTGQPLDAVTCGTIIKDNRLFDPPDLSHEHTPRWSSRRRNGVRAAVDG